MPQRVKIKRITATPNSATATAINTIMVSSLSLSFVSGKIK